MQRTTGVNPTNQTPIRAFLSDVIEDFFPEGQSGEEIVPVAHTNYFSTSEPLNAGGAIAAPTSWLTTTGSTFSFEGPALDTKTKVVYLYDTPGVKKKDLVISINEVNGVKTLSIATPESNRDYLQIFSLSEHLNFKEATATYTDGVVEVTIPKLQSFQKPVELIVPVI